MVRPASFGYNPQTAASNPFQQVLQEDPEDIREIAKQEFDGMVEILVQHGVEVTVFDDTPDIPRTDAVFPNNWISTHHDGRIILYSMSSPNRREERRAEVIEMLRKKFTVSAITDLSVNEKEKRYLEGTGSMVLDRVDHIAYACGSVRTDPGLFRQACRILDYQPVLFHAEDQDGIPVYHTNVMMAVAKDIALICLESIKDRGERNRVVQSLESTKHEILDISMDQLSRFAGNMLELVSSGGDRLLAMSGSAYSSLSHEQLKQLGAHCKPVPIPIPTIEQTAGGSVRCMIAEIFLPPLVS